MTAKGKGVSKIMFSWKKKYINLEYAFHTQGLQFAKACKEKAKLLFRLEALKNDNKALKQQIETLKAETDKLKQERRKIFNSCVKYRSIIRTQKEHIEVMQCNLDALGVTYAQAVNDNDSLEKQLQNVLGKLEVLEIIRKQ